MSAGPGRGVLMFLCLCACRLASGADAAPRVAIIIDDLGYERVAGERAISLPGPVAYAVLPGAPRTTELARLAHARGKDVLLHLPLQAASDTHGEPSSGLLLDMSRQQFRHAVGERIEAVPHIVGVNTHRGSLLTRHPGHMRWLMDEIAARGNLLFVDSYTTAQSVALRIANEQGIDAARRDVFLDPDRHPDTVVREFDRLKKIATRRGFAIGIGHPYPATLDYLARALPTLEAEGIELVGIRELVTIASGSRPLAISAE
jgi:polysaccharide deacetylase 2 family uncharacterized protein YibQ